MVGRDRSPHRGVTLTLLGEIPCYYLPMIVTLFYDESQPAIRKVQDLSRALDASRVQYRSIDADSEEGAAIGELYGIVRRPAVLVTQEDGTLVQLWQNHMPSADEVAYSAS